MRVHLVAPSPHSETTRRFEVDAFAAKCRRLASMLTRTGYEVILYGGPENEAQVAEHVPLVTREEQEGWFPGFDPLVDVFNAFDATSEPWRVYNGRAIAAIRERAEKGDILGLTMGLAHKPIADALEGLYVVETGIGYPGVFAPFRVYESQAWAHHLSDDVRFFDTVIPNSYDPGDFPAGTGKGGYHLFMGRFIRRKGIQIAVEATARLGVPLVMAGPGLVSRSDHTFSGVDVTVKGDHLTHVGSVGPEERARLMGEAAVFWCPTIYLEPFGSVAPEAMSTGTPVISTDWGAFTETVSHGLSGFRCRTLAEFVAAGKLAPQLDRERIRGYALARYSTEVTRHQYDAYFRRLRTLEGEGWYA